MVSFWYSFFAKSGLFLVSFLFFLVSSFYQQHCNRPRRFLNNVTIEIGLPDHHTMTISVLKTFYQKQSPIITKYRDYSCFDETLFRSQLLDQLRAIGNITYDVFENILLKMLNFHAPLKTKYLRANNAPFMNKTLSKAIMNRSMLRNKYLKCLTNDNKVRYNKQPNYCTSLLRREKKFFYNNTDLSLITDNKKFWKTVKPLFSDKALQ